MRVFLSIIFILIKISSYPVHAQEQNGNTIDDIIQEDSVFFIDSLAGKFVEVANILYIGNKKTKSRIIAREMDVKKGKQFYYEDLLQLLETDENKIFNTGLFNAVESRVIPKKNGQVDILIDLDERWYTWPAPIVQLADRNLNEWYNVFGADLSRINYGLLLDQYNMRGLNESMSFIAQFGFTRRFVVKYRMPYINKAQTWGLNMAFGYNENITIGYDVQDNVSVNISARDFENFEDRILQNTYQAELGVTYRESFYNSHRLIGYYRQQNIADTIAQLNPRFFLEGETEQRMFQLHYYFDRDLRDRRNYPLKGFLLQTNIQKYGLWVFNDVNFTSASFHYAHYMPLNDKGLYLASSASAYGSTARNQPFNMYNGLGYNITLIKGYDRILLQGQHYVLQKNELKQRLFDKKLDLGVVFPFLPNQFRNLPIATYAKLFFDHGYVYNDFPNYEISNLNRLNTYLYGTGVGLDLVSFYDFVMRFELAYNRDGDFRFNFDFKYGL